MSIFTLLEYGYFRAIQHDVPNPVFLSLGKFVACAGQEKQLLVANEFGKIIILRPMQKKSENGSENLAECIVSFDTHSSIVDLKVGRFSEIDTTKDAIAVVHRRRLRVYTIHHECTDRSDDTDKNVYQMPASYEMLTSYELEFELPIFQAQVTSRKTKTPDIDLIVLESFGPRIFVCRGSRILCSKDLERSTTGPVVLSDNGELLASFQSNMLLNCYKLDDVLHSAPVRNSELELIVPLWSLYFYEPIYCMKSVLILRDMVETVFFIAAGRNTIYIISQYGKVISSKMMDLTPSIICSYEIFEEIATDDGICGNSKQDALFEPNFLLTTMEGYLLVFKGTRILWSAQLPWNTINLDVPKLRREDLSSTANCLQVPTIGPNSPAGLIALLTSEGEIRLVYLGTNPIQQDSDRLQHDIQHEVKSEELKALDKKISSFAQDGLKPQTLTSRNHQQPRRVELQAKIREEGKLQNTKYFIDVHSLSCGNTGSSEYQPLFMTVSSCAPIVVSPNYINFVAQGAGSEKLDQSTPQPLCSLSLNVNHSMPVLTTQLQLLLGYTEQDTLSSSSPRTQFTATTVLLPLHWFYVGEASERKNVSGFYRLTFDVAPELVAHNFRLHEVLNNLWPPSDTRCALRLKVREENTMNSEEDEKSTHNGTFLLENTKRAQIRIQGDHPETFEPILKEIFQLLRVFCRQQGSIVPNNCLLRLSTPKSTEALDTKMPNGIGFAALPVINSLCEYLFASVCEHLESRIALATQVAANSVQARHFRMLQSHILSGMQDQLSGALTGFDSLLEASLHQLTEGCQLALKCVKKQESLGWTVMGVTSLLMLIGHECFQPCVEKIELNTVSRYLNPLKLVSIVKASDLVEVARGLQATPEEDDNSSNTDPGSYVGLEEYLDTAIGSLVNQLRDNDNDEIQRPASFDGIIPDPNKFMKQLLFVLDAVAGAKASNSLQTEKKE